MLFTNNFINGCGQAVTGVNVKIISHARGSSHERATQDGLRFCMFGVFITPWRLCTPDILMFSTGSQEYFTVGLLHGN